MERWWHKNEKLLFFVFSIFGLLPLFSGKYFYSLDGFAHLYNAQLIHDLLLNKNELTQSFYSFVWPIPPNSLVHFLAAFLLCFLPAFIVEKLILSFCLIALPFAFRYILHILSPQNKHLSFLIFPFCFTFMLFMGFYNFTLGISIAMFALGYFLKNFQNSTSIKNYVVLKLMTIGCFYSHVFVYGILVFCMGAYLSITYSFQWGSNEIKFRKSTIQYFKQLWAVFKGTAVSIVLFLQYLWYKPKGFDYGFWTKNRLFQELSEMSSLISPFYIRGITYTRILFVLMCVVSLWLIFNRFWKQRKDNIRRFAIFHHHDAWLFLSLIILLFYFIAPDSNGFAGYISIRLQYVFFLLFLIWLTLQKMHRYWQIVCIVFALFMSVQLNVYYFKYAKEKNKFISAVEKASKLIPANKIVLPIDYTQNWETGHLSNLLGVDKELVILENYECSTGYFPLTWNRQNAPAVFLGEKSTIQTSCVWWLSSMSSEKKPIDYVLILGKMDKKDSCTNQIFQKLSNYYSLIQKSSYCTLYQLKK